MKELFLHRRDTTTGQRTRWRFLLDEGDTIISEQEAPEPDTTTPGITVEMVKGQRTVTKVSPEQQKILGFFVASTPCWFEGCNELREKYLAEVAAQPAGCPDCQKGAIIRKYKAIIETRLQLLAPVPAHGAPA